MQKLNQCFSCKKCFSILRVPLNLPCKHSLCSVCIHNEYEDQKQNKCPQCQKVSKQKPLSLQRNEKIINEILEKEVQQEKLQQEIIDLKSMQSNFKRLVKQIKEKQNTIQQEILNYIKENMFRNSNQILNEIVSLISKIGTYLTLLEKQQAQVKATESEIETKKMQENLNKKVLQNIENQGETELQNLEEQQNQFLNYLKSLNEKIENPVFHNFDKAAFSSRKTSVFCEKSEEKTPRKSLQIAMLEEINQEAQQIPLNKQIKGDIQYITTFKKGEKIKLEYFLESHRLISAERNILKPESNATQIEQIKNTFVILSGGIILTKRRFTVLIEETGQIKEFQMNDQRRFHRTV